VSAPDALRIEPVTDRDIPGLLELIKELAGYEQLSEHVSATVDGLAASLLGDRQVAEAVTASIDGKKVGYAIWFHTFSSFLGQRGLGEPLQDSVRRINRQGRDPIHGNNR
jgi:hypothetical protein